MKKINKYLLKKQVIILILILTLPLAMSFQDYIYYLDNDALNLMNASYEADIFSQKDLWFRYRENSFSSCFENQINDNTDTYNFDTLILELDCDEYNLYNLIRFLRDNKDNFILVKGRGLSIEEASSANALASFLQINNIKQDTDYSSVPEGNVILIGKPSRNSLTEDLMDWNYASGEGIARFIVENEKIKIILAGTDVQDTLDVIKSFTDKVHYYESFTEDCLIIEGCDYVCYPADLSCNENIDSRELLLYIDEYYNSKASRDNIIDALIKWIYEL